MTKLFDQTALCVCLCEIGVRGVIVSVCMCLCDDYWLSWRGQTMTMMIFSNTHGNWGLNLGMLQLPSTRPLAVDT